MNVKNFRKEISADRPENGKIAARNGAVSGPDQAGLPAGLRPLSGNPGRPGPARASRTPASTLPAGWKYVRSLKGIPDDTGRVFARCPAFPPGLFPSRTTAVRAACNPESAPPTPVRKRRDSGAYQSCTPSSLRIPAHCAAPHGRADTVRFPRHGRAPWTG